MVEHLEQQLQVSPGRGGTVDCRAGPGRVAAGRGTATLGEAPGANREHVYHLIVSLPPGEEWTDQQWATVAIETVAGMGFTTGEQDEQGCRWVAMRHVAPVTVLSCPAIGPGEIGPRPRSAATPTRP